MTEKLPQDNSFPSVFLRLGLITVLLASGTGVFFSVRWIYDRVQNSLSLDLAEVVVAFLAIFILGLMLVGFAAGFGAKRVLRTRRAHARKIYHSLKWCKIFQALWGYIGPPLKVEQNATPREQDVPEIMLLADRAPKRGRIPTYPMDRWIKVVSAWENRNTWRNPITLDEFLSQEFGTNADGSPRISRKTYYDWRKKVREQAREHPTISKDISP